MVLILPDAVDPFSSPVEIKSVTGDQFEICRIIAESGQFPPPLLPLREDMRFLCVCAGQFFVQRAQSAHLRNGKNCQSNAPGEEKDAESGPVDNAESHCAGPQAPGYGALSARVNRALGLRHQN